MVKLQRATLISNMVMDVVTDMLSKYSKHPGLRCIILMKEIPSHLGPGHCALEGANQYAAETGFGRYFLNHCGHHDICNCPSGCRNIFERRAR